MKKTKIISMCVLLAILLVVLFAYQDMIRRIWSFYRENAKDATVIIANNNDQTMKEVHSEFKKFNAQGYAYNLYPELEKLYQSRENWKYDKITWFNTSMKMLSFGADKAISINDWSKFVDLLDDAIAGYKQFIPINQETMAITYIHPIINLSKRLVSSPQYVIPHDTKKQIIDRIYTLKRLIGNAPEESTNDIKKKTLSDISIVITNLSQ